MKLVLASLFFCFVTQSFLSFSEVLVSAKADNKKVLLVFSGSDWCHGCISFKKNVTGTAEFARYAKTDIVYYLADFPRDRKTITEEQLTENQRLAELYNKKGMFPHVVLFAADGAVLRQRSGAFKTFEELKTWVEE